MTEVLYRKYRPQTFAEVVGQDAIVRTLRNAIASGRVAHAYLLGGPSGTGKTSIGRLIAKAVNCAAPVEGEPCNRCDSCRALLESRALDLVEIDAVINRGIGDMRKLCDRVCLAPMVGQYKVYLIEDAHKLTKDAVSVLLRILEEPPQHIIFILTTTEPDALPPTITSRCQQFSFDPIPTSVMLEPLSRIARNEGCSLDGNALDEVARESTGNFRAALGILQKVITVFAPDEPSTTNP